MGWLWLLINGLLCCLTYWCSVLSLLSGSDRRELSLILIIRRTVSSLFPLSNEVFQILNSVSFILDSPWDTWIMIAWTLYLSMLEGIRWSNKSKSGRKMYPQHSLQSCIIFISLCNVDQSNKKPMMPDIKMGRASRGSKRGRRREWWRCVNSLDTKNRWRIKRTDHQ